MPTLPLTRYTKVLRMCIIINHLFKSLSIMLANIKRIITKYTNDLYHNQNKMIPLKLNIHEKVWFLR